MIVLATGSPDAEAGEDRITVTIPSGKDEVQIALTPHHAMLLAAKIQMAFKDVVDPTIYTAEIVTLPRKRRKSRRQ